MAASLSGAQLTDPGIAWMFECAFMHDATPPPAFGKLNAKAQVAVATAARPTRLENAATRVRAMLSSHGPLALKVYVALWIVAVLASAFVIMKTR